MTQADDAVPALLREKPTWLISQVSTHAHRLLTERLATAGMRGYHFRLLAALEEFGPASQASLGRRTDMDRSDVAATVTELTTQKLAERVTDQADRRRKLGAARTAAHRGKLQRQPAADELSEPGGQRIHRLSMAHRAASGAFTWCRAAVSRSFPLGGRRAQDLIDGGPFRVGRGRPRRQAQVHLADHPCPLH